MRIAIRVPTLTFLVLLLAGCSTATRSPIGETVELRFWAGRGAKSDHRVLEVSAHCCCSGEIALARVSQLPMPGTRGMLQPEVAVELTDGGVVVRRWPMPVDLIVAGVNGEQILVPLAPMVGANFEGGILISPQGSVSLTTVPPQLPKPVLYTCPVIREFGESAYLRCFEFHDLSSGELRRLAFEGPCT